jgi:NAD+ synthase (glutamine-hydrolysing)
VAVPKVQVADPVFNITEIITLAKQAAARHAVLTVFPELCVTAYSNEDLFQQQALLETVERELRRLLHETRTLGSILIVGAPLMLNSKLYNCAFVIQGGSILGIIPKSYLPNQAGFNESRQFRAAHTAGNELVDYAQQRAIPLVQTYYLVSPISLILLLPWKLAPIWQHQFLPPALLPWQELQ